MHIKEIIRPNIEKVLEFYGFKNIKKNGKEIRCGRDKDSNPTSISINLDKELLSMDFAKNISGDIISLIMEIRGLSYREIVSDMRNLFNIDIDYKGVKKRNHLDDIFGNLISNKSKELDIYPDIILEQYEDVRNFKFLKDGISLSTQKKFEIMYDKNTNRIVIPHRTTQGDICGIIGRKNDSNKYGAKYLPLIPYPKSTTLYGYSQNYNNLINADTIYVGEAEKFVLQLDSMGVNNSVALCGANLSDIQAMLLVDLKPTNIVFCFDEGLDEMIIFKNLNKMKSYLDLSYINIGYMLDKENKYIKKGSHDSPTDNGVEIWEQLVKECIVWY